MTQTYEHLNTGDVFMIIRIVDRCHIAHSLRDVIRYFQSYLSVPWKQVPREVRHEFIRCIAARHKANREFYREVMGSVNENA